ncbi:hypothetical protein KUTeg_023188 [Tegillarca granosa]|uniref:Alpha-1,3-mannosyl-glycoprotein 4-beta-N-acetylglucosaminyltransferase C n=1 Tax=Tegillarca granosa TaxID=220873 RepID=A0ABQ9E744_TEGGR|nr:hypothetical protein KUTeg_023188 [Tegillarca granosa]
MNYNWLNFSCSLNLGRNLTCVYRQIDASLQITEQPESMVIHDNNMNKGPSQSDVKDRAKSFAHKVEVINKNREKMSRLSNEKGYLYETLDSLIENTSDEDKEEITVVIFVADFNTSWNLLTAQNIYNTYKNFCESGFIHVIHAKSKIYPPFSKLERTFNDPMPRVVWRSKQNIDFALLMLYTKSISVYYMQLEDDVISAKSFLKDIKKFIVQQTKQKWVCLEFSKLGFIGKLFRTNLLDKVANILLTLFDVMPCDILLGSIRDLLGQKKPIHSKQSLFQHIGKVSSLKNKIMPSIDNTFKELGSRVLDVMRVPRGDNPDAKIETNLRAATNEYLPEYAYKNSSSFFWASDPGPGKYYRIIFDKPLDISQIIVSTGDRMKKNDILKFGSLKVGKTKQCDHLTEVAKFVEGHVDTLIQGVTFPPPSNNIQCISIDIKKSQRNWLVIDKISYFDVQYLYSYFKTFGVMQLSGSSISWTDSYFINKYFGSHIYALFIA